MMTSNESLPSSNGRSNSNIPRATSLARSNSSASSSVSSPSRPGTRPATASSKADSSIPSLIRSDSAVRRVSIGQSTKTPGQSIGGQSIKSGQSIGGQSIKYKPGDVIIDSIPIAYCLNQEKKSLHCDYCFKSVCSLPDGASEEKSPLGQEGSLKKCGGCKSFYYCDRKCQSHDWKAGHKFDECKIYLRAIEAANGNAPSSEGLERRTSTGGAMGGNLTSSAINRIRRESESSVSSGGPGSSCSSSGRDSQSSDRPITASGSGIHSSNGSQERSLLVRDCDRLLLRLHLKIQHDPRLAVKRFNTPDGGTRSLESLMDHHDNITKDEVRMRYFNRSKELFKILGIRFNEDRLFSLYGKICINSFTINDISLNSIGSGIFLEASIFDHSCEPNASFVTDTHPITGIHAQVRAIKPIKDGERILINYIDIKLSAFDRRMKLHHQYYFSCDCNRCNYQKKSADRKEKSADRDNYEMDAISVEIKKLDEEFDNIVGDAHHRDANQSADDRDWKRAYYIAMKSLELYEKIYGDWHPDLTVQLFRVIRTRMLITDEGNNYHQNFDPTLQILVKKLASSIQITHGSNHSLFTAFKDLFH